MYLQSSWGRRSLIPFLDQSSSSSPNANEVWNLVGWIDKALVCGWPKSNWGPFKGRFCSLLFPWTSLHKDPGWCISVTLVWEQIFTRIWTFRGFPDSASDKVPACQCRRCKRHGFGHCIRKIARGGHGSQLQYYCLENRMDRGVWQTTVQEVTRDGLDWSHLAHAHA